jgi:hypothetical protein
MINDSSDRHDDLTPYSQQMCTSFLVECWSLHNWASHDTPSDDVKTQDCYRGTDDQEHLVLTSIFRNIFLPASIVHCYRHNTATSGTGVVNSQSTCPHKKSCNRNRKLHTSAITHHSLFLENLHVLLRYPPATASPPLYHARHNLIDVLQ